MHHDSRHSTQTSSTDAAHRHDEMASSSRQSHAAHQAHDKHAGHDPEVFRRRFWLSLLLTVPVVIFSDSPQRWFGYSLAGVPGHGLVSPILGAAVFLYGGHVFL